MILNPLLPVPSSFAAVWLPALSPGQIGYIDSFGEQWSSALLLPDTEISSWLQSHYKFRLSCMVYDFVIYISYGCSSHMNAFHFTFSKIHRLKLCPFLPWEEKAECSASRESRVGERGKKVGRRERKKVLPFFNHTEVSVCFGEIWGYVKNWEELFMNFIPLLQIVCAI